MAFLVRKAMLGRWTSDPLSADTLSSELRTRNNKLSFWFSESGSPEDLVRIAVGLVAAGRTVESIGLIWVPMEEVKAARLILEPSVGRTPLKTVREQHRDLVGLRADDLPKVAHLLAQSVREGRCRVFEKGRIKDRLEEAIAREAVALGELHPSLLLELKGDDYRRNRKAVRRRLCRSLETVRRDAGLSYREIGRRAGLLESHVEEVLRCRGDVILAALSAVCAALHCDLLAAPRSGSAA